MLLHAIDQTGIEDHRFKSGQRLGFDLNSLLFRNFSDVSGDARLGFLQSGLVGVAQVDSHAAEPAITLTRFGRSGDEPTVATWGGPIDSGDSRTKVAIRAAA